MNTDSWDTEITNKEQHQSELTLSTENEFPRLLLVMSMS